MTETKAKKTTKPKKSQIEAVKTPPMINAKSVAKWLVVNTTLTFEQIANSTGLDIMEIHAISDGFIANDYLPVDPITKGYFSREDINEAQNNELLTLNHLKNTKDLFSLSKKAKYHYTPMTVRYNRISGAMWILNNYPKVPPQKVVKLTKVSKSIAESIKDKTYKNVYNLNAQDPVILGVCTLESFNEFCKENESYKAKPQ